MKLKKSKNKGFSLIELIVTIALLGVASTVLLVSYTNVMEKKRQETDLQRLKEIDHSVQQIFLQDDAFNEVYPQDKKKQKWLIDVSGDKINDELKFIFHLSTKENKKKVVIELGNARVNHDEYSIQSILPIVSDYMDDYIEWPIELKSSKFQLGGKYEVVVKFGSSQVAANRPLVCNNDDIQVTNSGSEFLGKP